MTTKIVDPKLEIGNIEGLKQDLREATLMQPAGEETSHMPVDGNAGTDALNSGVPEKYAGKSVTEVIEMHRHLETAFGRQSNDLGQQRKLTDKLLDLKRTEDLVQHSPETLPDISSNDLLDNPTQALDKYLDARELRVAATTDQRLAEMETVLAQERFQLKHQDYSQIANDPAFAAWCGASPLRSRYAQAAIAGNWTAADELLDEYKNDPAYIKALHQLFL